MNTDACVYMDVSVDVAFKEKKNVITISKSKIYLHIGIICKSKKNLSKSKMYQNKFSFDVHSQSECIVSTSRNSKLISAKRKWERGIILIILIIKMILFWKRHQFDNFVIIPTKMDYYYLSCDLILSGFISICCFYFCLQNLDNWKSSRRKRVEHIIDRVVEAKKLEMEEIDRSRKKSKTFSEMMEERWVFNP